MKKLVLTLFASIFALVIFPQFVIAEEQQDEYVTIILQVNNRETGEVVSREYFDVKLSAEEFNDVIESYLHLIQPFGLGQVTRHIATGSFTYFGTVQTPSLINARPTWVDFVRGDMPSIAVEVRSGTLNTLLGSATLRQHEYLYILVGHATFSFTVSARSHSIAGSATLSIH